MKNLGSMVREVLLVVLGTITPAGVFAGDPVESELKQIRAELQAMRQQIEEQGKMLRTLYEFADSEMHFEDKKRTQEEDKKLLLTTVCEITDSNLTSLGAPNPSAPEFAVITGDGRVRVYEAHGRIVHSLKTPEHIITALSYSPDGKLLLTGTKAGALLVWEVASEKCTVVAKDLGSPIARVAWLSGKEKVAWGASVSYYGDGSKPINRDKTSGAVIERTSGKVCWTFQSFIRDDFQTLCSSPNGNRLVVLEIPDKPRGAFVLDGATGAALLTLFHAQHGSGPLSVAASSSGTVAVGYAPRDVILWDAQTGGLLKILEGHGNWVVSLCFSRDGRFLVSGAGDSTARVWALDSGREIGRLCFPGPSTYIDSVGFSSDGEAVFALTDGQLVVAKAPKLVR